MNTIKDYYRNEQVLQSILDSVEHPEWRVWKAELSNGNFVQNKKRINSTKKLKEFLLQQDQYAAKVYVSVSKFLHPETCYGKYPKKAQYTLNDTLFLGSELLFDLDSKNLSVAHADGKKIIKYMSLREHGYQLLNIRYSGHQGFHILYKDLDPIISSDPIKRLELTAQRRSELAQRLPDLTTIDDIHKKVMADQFRVHAAINTIKSKTGYIVKQIPLKDFMLFSTFKLQEKYLKMVVRQPPNSFTSDSKQRLPMITGSVPHPIEPDTEGATITSYPLSYNFVTNRVKGIKNGYVTVLRWAGNTDRTKIIRDVQRKYNLSNFYRFDYNNCQMWLNFKLVDFRRLVKILRFAKCKGISSLLFYKHSWIPVSEERDNDGNIIWEKPELKEIIYSEYGVKDTHSLPHLNLLSIKEQVMAGNEENMICKAIISKRVE